MSSSTNEMVITRSETAAPSRWTALALSPSPSHRRLANPDPHLVILFNLLPFPHCCEFICQLHQLDWRV